MTAEWHLITGEYPPQTGGVSDHTRVIAEGLAAAGERVQVWCPPASPSSSSGGEAEWPAVDGGGGGAGAGRVVVRREMGRFAPADLRRVGRLLDSCRGPRRLLVQYVPHAYGWRSMNVALCLWLWRRAAKGDSVEVLVHEPFLEFRAGAWRRCAAAAVHRLMAWVLLRAARRVWVTIPAWGALWRPLALGRRVPFEWLPVPSTVGVVDDPARVASLRARYAPPGGVLLGHLGTYPAHVEDSLKRLLPPLLSAHPAATALLLGRGSERVREALARAHPALAGRVHASGVVSAAELSCHLAACDLLAQPFPDGVSSRRTSVMAGLAHGRPVVTTRGRLTESLWAESGAVALAPAQDPRALSESVGRLLEDAEERDRLGAAGLALYEERFKAERAVAALRREECDPAPDADAPRGLLTPDTRNGHTSN